MARNQKYLQNAKEEFIEHIEDMVVKCAIIHFDDGDYNWDEDIKEMTDCILKVNYTKEDYDVFLKSIDKPYDSGYGGQVLFGTIWYTDGTWSNRGEYDGSEWWIHHKCPIVPDSLI